MRMYPLDEGVGPDKPGKQEGAALIFAGGNLDPDGEQAALLRGPWQHVICADGGARHARACGLTPTLLVGDMDSIDDESRRLFLNVPTLTFPTAKNMTDSQLALDWALEQGARRVVLAGGVGSRFDHSLANAQLLAVVERAGARGVVTDGRQAVYLLTGRLQVRAPRGFLLSVIPLGECRGLTLRGLRWELDDFHLTIGDTRTISNEFAGDVAMLSLMSGVALVVTSPPDGPSPSA